MTVLLFAALLLTAQPGPDRTDTLSLEYCHRRVEEYYPVSDKIELQQRITELNRQIARTGYYPDVTFSGMASYQSDVTEVTFAPPGGSVPTFSKDHYRVGLDLTQPIYNGGLTGARKALEEAKGEKEVHAVEVQLQDLKEQVNRVYFSALLLQQQSRSVTILMSNLRQQLTSVRSRVRNGVLLPGQAAVLEAELIGAEQDSIRLRAERAGALEALGLLIGEEVPGAARLEIPSREPDPVPGRPLQRPEYRVFSSGRTLLDEQISMTGARALPVISAFTTAAYGRPGLNAFDDDLQPYYIVGVRLRWNFWDSFNAGKERQALRYEQQKIDADEQAFTLQLQGALARLRDQIEALGQIIRRDEEIIQLSEQVVEESSTRLNEGVITATEYLLELNRLHQAQLNREVHEIQLAKAKTDYQTQTGGF